MKSTIAPVGLPSPESVKIYPNGECVIWRNRIKKVVLAREPEGNETSTFLWNAWQLYQVERKAFAAACLYMGLSLLQNFDSLANRPNSRLIRVPTFKGKLRGRLWSCTLKQLRPVEKPVRRYGLKGISRRAARTIRNAAHLMQESIGRQNLTFATVTVPALPVEQMATLHKNWHKVVESYRLAITRRLKDEGVCEDIIVVSEVQEKRHEKTGIPVLHLHAIFQGRRPFGKWLISTETHDDITRIALERGAGPIGVSLKSAAQFQQVHSSAGAYLGKYMSKGRANIESLVEQGFADWMPKQWWSMSRRVRQEVDRQTLRPDGMAQFLLAAAYADDKDIWSFHGEVTLDIGQSQEYWLATYGRLQPHFVASVKSACGK